MIPLKGLAMIITASIALAITLIFPASAWAQMLARPGDTVNWQVSCVYNNGTYDPGCVRVADAVAVLPNASRYVVNFTEYGDGPLPGVWIGNWSIPSTGINWPQFYTQVAIQMYLRNSNNTNGTLSLTFTVVASEWATAGNISVIGNNLNTANSSIHDRLNTANSSIHDRINTANASIQTKLDVLASNINNINVTILAKIDQANATLVSQLLALNNSIHARINTMNSSLFNAIFNGSLAMSSTQTIILGNINTMNTSLHNVLFNGSLATSANQIIILDNINFANSSLHNRINTMNTSLFNAIFNGSLATSANQAIILNNLNTANTSIQTTLSSLNNTVLLINRTMIDNLSAGLGGIVWNYPNRNLTLINWSVFVDWNTSQLYIWNATNRTLTEYNQSGTLELLGAINATVITLDVPRASGGPISITAADLRLQAIEDKVDNISSRVSYVPTLPFASIGELQGLIVTNWHIIGLVIVMLVLAISYNRSKKRKKERKMKKQEREKAIKGQEEDMEW